MAIEVFQLQSFNFQNRFIRHKSFLGELTPISTTDLQDFSFKIVPRGANLVSLKSVNFPKLSLRHQDFRIKLQGPTTANDTLFRADSTFFLEPGLANPRGVSFRSSNISDHYIRHRDFHLFLDPRDSPNLAADATFFKTVRID